MVQQDISIGGGGYQTATSANRDRLIARESANVVLLFDDVQWCDESSVAALDYVARMEMRD
jgi:hypothetical protein